MPRLPRPLVQMFVIGSCLAAVTACGKRVERTAREDTPTTTSPTTTSPTTTSPTAQPEPGRPQSSSLVHVTAEQFDALIQSLGRRGTLVNVWATWCGPCREELPMLAKVQRQYASQGISVLPLSVDEPEHESKIASMLEGYGFTGPFYVAARPLEDIKRRLNENWPGNIPVSFLFDREARRRFFWTAQVYENELTPKLDRFLEGKLETGQANFGIAPGKTF